MTKQEAGRLGGLATYRKHGREHMARIGSKGFWATIASLSERQYLDPANPVNPYRHLLRNLIAKKNKVLTS